MITHWQLVKAGVFAGCNVEDISFGFLGLRGASGRLFGPSIKITSTMRHQEEEFALMDLLPRAKQGISVTHV
jgi:hypothetical protein